MELRGHHLLCLLGFQGHGYSDGFVLKMRELAPIYRDETNNHLIYITPSTDVICRSCPAISGKQCTTFKRVDDEINLMDNRILDKLKLHAGDHYSKQTIFRHIRENLKPDDLDSLCKGCKWLGYGVCKAAIQQMKTNKETAKNNFNDSFS